MTRLSNQRLVLSQTVTLQFDTNGRQVGSAFEFHGNDNALRALEQKMGTPTGELPVWSTDAATVRNASWMAIGNEYFYLIW